MRSLLSDKPLGQAIHATAVAIDCRALLILGASGTGKSELAASLLASETLAGRVELIGDDRILLTTRGTGELLTRPHPRIAGFIERRGLGIVAMHHLAEAPVAAIAKLDHATTKPAVLQNLPMLLLVGIDVRRRCDLVEAWWSSQAAAFGTQCVGKRL